jgi:hypothetical protein
MKLHFSISYRNISAVMLTAFATMCGGGTACFANTVTTVPQVTARVTVSTATDYTITGTTPFTSAGSVNLTGADAVVILKAVIPSATLKSYMDNILINGTKSVNGSNCTVQIYGAGTIVLPYTMSSGGLTVYTGENFGGESKTYPPAVTYTSLGTFANAIRSFKLRRGYMACIGTSASFNKVYVASDADLEVSALPKTMSGKVNFLRVLPWIWTGKKGFAGGDMTANSILNTTEFYGWDAGNYSRTDREYTPQHHHIGWPAIGDCTGHSDGTAILGNNEPDNLNDAKEQVATVANVLASWPQMMSGGQRLGSPAVSGNLSGWLYPFIDSIDAKGYRCDFVAVHAYWNSNPTNFMNSLKSISDRTGRPLWITEFNYGANWTSEWWPASDHSITTANWERERAWMAELIPLLEAAPYVERYYIYNWVQDCRMVYVAVSNHTKCTGGCTATIKANDAARIAAIKAAGGTYATTVNDTLEYYLSPAGKAYSSTSGAQLAYTGKYQIEPTFPYQKPYGLAYTYGAASQTVTLSWQNPNGVQTDSAYIERKLDMGNYVVLDTLYSNAAVANTYRDALKNLDNGLYTYRIHNFDSDGMQRYTSTVSVTKGGAEGAEGFQYGSMTLANTDFTYVSYTPLQDGSKPLVFVSPSTFNNNLSTTMVAPAEHLASVTSTQFKFQYFPWTYPSSIPTTLSKSETSNFLVIKPGSYTFGNMKLVAAAVPSKVGSDTLAVTFDEPFAEDVTPVVFTTALVSMNIYPYMLKTWDVSNKGFKVRAMRQAAWDGTQYTYMPSQTVYYLAVTPGQASMDNGQVLTADTSSTAIYGSVKRSVALKNGSGKAYSFDDTPLLFVQSQTYNMPAATLLRVTEPTTSSEGVWTSYVFRQVDGSATSVSNTSKTADKVGWFALSTDKSYVDRIGAVTDGGTVPLIVNVIGRRISMAGGRPCKVYNLSGEAVNAGSQLAPGLYIVRCGTQSAKVLVR